MHQARTAAQFTAIGEQCLEKWMVDDEDFYATWFQEVYLSSPWETWYVGSAGEVSGILPNQNPFESFHRTIKKVAVSSLRASTATLLNSTLPAILRMVAKETPEVEAPICHYVVRMSWKIALCIG